VADYTMQKKMLGESFLYDKKLIQPHIEYYSKLKERELQVAYILLAIEPGNKKQADSLREVSKEIYSRLQKGEDFADLAKLYSSDKETGEKGGVLPNYVTAGKIQRSIETVVFALKPGEYYKGVLETPYGFFLLKLLREEPRQLYGARQILISTKDSSSKIDFNKKADEILAKLKKGEDFSKLAEKNSDDAQTSINGGYFGENYSRVYGLAKSGRYLPNQVVDEMSKMKACQISGKIISEQGIHIIKMDSIIKFPKETELDDITKFYKRLYLDEDKQKFIDSLAIANGFKINESVYTKFVSALDSNKTNLDTAWLSKVQESLRDEVLFSYGKKTWKLSNYIEENTKNKSKFRGTANTHAAIRKVISKIVEPFIIEDEVNKLEKDYPEFAQNLSEFYDAILLFKAESNEVWDKIKFDSIAARNYWDSTRAKYRTDRTYDVVEIFVVSDSVAKEIYEKAKSGEDFDELAAKNTIRPGYKEKKGFWPNMGTKKGKFSFILSSMNYKEGEILEPKKLENGYCVLKIKKVIEPREKTFEEAIPDFSNVLQDMTQKKLLKNWLENIKSKHPVSINENEIDQILKSNKN
jgi:peptidyl-prolyl cis-trans isomerase SurA